MLNIADDVLCRRLHRPRLVCLHLERRLAEPDTHLVFNDFLKLLRFAVTSRAVRVGGCTSHRFLLLALMLTLCFTLVNRIC